MNSWKDYLIKSKERLVDYNFKTSKTFERNELEGKEILNLIKFLEENQLYVIQIEKFYDDGVEFKVYEKTLETKEDYKARLETIVKQSVVEQISIDNTLTTIKNKIYDLK